MYNDINYDTIYNEIQCKIEYNIQYDAMDNENNMIQWTVQYRYNRQ